MVAHDGFQIERFADLPGRPAAREALKLPADTFVVGYIGQLHTMSMGKGLDVLIDAIAEVRDVPVTLCLVGGPADMVDALRQRWQASGLPGERLLTPGRVEPSRVPLYIRAFDVCSMTFPWTEHFAYYASPLKLFEYMAVGGTILASDLPSIAEVVRDGDSALLVPPSDVNAIVTVLRRLWADPALRERLGARAREAAAAYSWAARADHILERIQRRKNSMA
jgi:glycosyltransferase involved in cell wall biosynthesis